MKMFVWKIKALEQQQLFARFTHGLAAMTQSEFSTKSTTLIITMTMKNTLEKIPRSYLILFSFLLYVGITTIMLYTENEQKTQILMDFEHYKAHIEQNSKQKHPFRGISQVDGLYNLRIGVPVLPVNQTTNKIIFSEEVKRVWFDVGAHKEAMNTLPSLRSQPDLAIIAFEPMYDMWGQLTMTKHHPRLYTLPVAVSTEDGYATFRRAETDMCSSLKGIDTETNPKNWPGGCTGTSFQFTVPTVRLETIIEMLPFDTVEFLKIDAQGADFEVVISAGQLLSRIKWFVVEVQTQSLYAGSKNETEFIEYFEARGFEMYGKKFQNLREENIVFRNKLYTLEASNIPLSKFLDLKQSK